MNSLSWLIYLADVIGGIGRGVLLIGVVLSMLGAILLLVYLISSSSSDEIDEKVVVAVKPYAKAFLFIGPLIWIIGLAVPSRQAVYMIAASEMGQKVYETPATQEMLGDLKDIVSKELKKMKERTNER